MGNLDLERVWHSVVRLAFRRDYVGSIPTARSNHLRLTATPAPLKQCTATEVVRNTLLWTGWFAAPAHYTVDIHGGATGLIMPAVVLRGLQLHPPEAP
jgi:hypothetical protein